MIRSFLRNFFLRWRTEERFILEKKIFPKIRDKKVLWVGCESYTFPYIKMLRKNNLYTIDIVPEMSKFGHPEKHIIDTIANIEHYFPKNSLDIVFLTGIFGYGLNDTEEAEKTLRGIHKVLKPKGHLILWWSDNPGKNPIIPRKLKSRSLFKDFSIKQYKSGYRTKKNVVLEFLEK